MKKRPWYALLIAGNILLIILFLVLYTNASYPMVGNDFSGFTTRLLDSFLYYKANGFGIEWYTPNFGGGLPTYADPMQMQFSLQQLLTWFINPYPAILAAAAIYLTIGFLVTYLFLKNTIELRPLPAILGTDFFLINGFIVERVVAGHVNLLTFPLIILPIYLLLHPRMPAWIAGMLISFTGAVLIYSGGVYIAFICLFSAMMLLPLVFFVKPGLFSWQRILRTLLWGASLTLLLCGSKLYATMEYMRFFNRLVYDQYGTNWITGLAGMVAQLVGSLNFFPALALLHKNGGSFAIRLIKWMKTPYGFWELDTSITPTLTLMLVIGFLQTILRHKHLEIKKVEYKRIIAWICLLLSILLVTQFSTAKGFLYNLLKNLPVIQSLHANVRFTTSFILPLAFLGALVFDRWVGKWKSGLKRTIAFAVLDGISLASLWSYYILPFDFQVRHFDITSIDRTYQVAATGKALPVHQINPAMNDYEVFIQGASNTTHHADALFRDNNELLTPLVHEGSVFDVQDGYYNMTNPSSLIFPEVNGVFKFEPIPVTDTQKLLDFINHRQSDWKLPVTQKVLDWAAGITFSLEFLALIAWLLNSQIFKKMGRHNRLE